MKICLAQIKPVKGDIQKNITNHIQFIQEAITLGSDVIIFPELSITGYEPKLAKQLAVNINDHRFEEFQTIANVNDIVIGIGMPTNAHDGINISMIIFRPNQPRSFYSKHQLDEDELDYFNPGNSESIFKFKNINIAIGICYETLHRECFINAKQNKADVFIASVAKPKSGIEKAVIHYPKMAQEFNLPVLMSNSVGFCDNFMCVGQSGIWDNDGRLLEQLDDKTQGLLIFYLDNEITSSLILNSENEVS